MTPTDFVVFDGGSEPNRPTLDIYLAMHADVKILGPDGEYEVLSYYYDQGQMVLDVQRID